MSAPRSMNLADWKAIGLKAIKTAVQVGIGAIGVNLAGITDLDTAKAAAIAAASAGAAVIMNGILAWATDTGPST